MKRSTLIYVQFALSAAMGSIIACSPTKFDVAPSRVCESGVDTCIVENGITSLTQSFKVGAGKVDILFIDDNSASMSQIQSRLAARFSGFVEALDRREINYQIGITTTDINLALNDGLITFGNGSQILKSSDSNRVSLFNGGIVRTETVACENFMKSAYYTYGPSFNSTSYYAQNYNTYCPSGDERGIYSAYEVLSKNVGSLVRDDANLNVILLSNEDVRSGLYSNTQYPQYALEDKDKAANLISMINSTYSGKYWEFNSIITKDAACATQQQQDFRDNNGQTIRDAQGNYVIGANIGVEYAAVSASASQDIDGNAAPRGQTLNICSNDYAAYFANIAAKIADSARLLTLRCNPMEAPVITNAAGQSINIPYSWDGSDKIVFQRGSEGIQIKVAYRCNTGVR